MVSGLGFEPRMTGPKPVVIPFHHPEVNGHSKSEMKKMGAVRFSYYEYAEGDSYSLQGDGGF